MEMERHFRDGKDTWFVIVRAVLQMKEYYSIRVYSISSQRRLIYILLLRKYCESAVWTRVEVMGNHASCRDKIRRSIRRTSRYGGIPRSTRKEGREEERSPESPKNTYFSPKVSRCSKLQSAVVPSFVVRCPLGQVGSFRNQNSGGYDGNDVQKQC